MANHLIKHLLLGGALCAGSTLLLTSCVDDTYDVNKIDLTMKIGSEGISAPLGNTEKIYLDDILDVDESVKLDANNLYYLVEDGTTHFNVKVDKVNTTFNDARMSMNYEVVNYEKVRSQLAAEGINVPAGTALPIAANFVTDEAEAEGNQSIEFSIKDINDVSFVESIAVTKTPVTLKLYKQNSSDNVKLGIKTVRGLVISIPKVLHVSDYDKTKWDLVEATGNATHHQLKQKGTLTLNNVAEVDLCNLSLDRVDLNRSVDNSKEISLTGDDANISLTGKVAFGNYGNQQFEMHEGDYASVRLDIKVGNNNRLTANTVTGKFCPAINPTVNDIDIAESLPDFLKDKEVCIDASNPTLRFTSDMTNIPVGVNLSGVLTSVMEDGNNPEPVRLPATSMEAQQSNTVYYYQGTAPYDPEGTRPITDQAKVTNLNSLIKKLPERIKVDLSNGKVSVQDKLYTIELGRNYEANADYSVFVPFEFNGELTIVYNDSTSSMHDDLKDLKSNGTLKVSANVLNTIPLDLVVGIEARDVNGNVIPGITFTDAIAAAGDGTNEKASAIELTAKLQHEDDLSKIDRIHFKVRAKSANNDSHQLVSTQYLKLNDIKVRVEGGVIADFN